MPGATAAALERVNAFPVDGTVLVKHYFDGDDVFARLKPYYNGSQYRFEVPVDEFDSLRRYLREHGYDVRVVEDPAAFYVVVRQYTEHPEGIFKDAVRQESADGYNCFLMKDRRAVDVAVARGATRLASKPLSVRSGTLSDYAAPSV